MGFTENKISKAKTVNIILKYNFLIGLISGIWLFLFLFLIKPFKQDKLSVLSSFKIAISMGFATVLCYFLIIFIQNKLFKKYKKWTFKLEVLLMFIFLSFNFIGIFFIYKSKIADGSYTAFRFFYQNFIPAVIIILPIILILRAFFFKRSYQLLQPKFIFLYGENKLDFIKLKKEDLISVSSAQNYVEISYLINNELHKKLIRKSLKKAQLDLPFLIKVHRSHLINLMHFVSFKDKKTLKLTLKEIPYSDTYKNNLIPK